MSWKKELKIIFKNEPTNVSKTDSSNTINIDEQKFLTNIKDFFLNLNYVSEVLSSEVNLSLENSYGYGSSHISGEIIVSFVVSDLNQHKFETSNNDKTESDVEKIVIFYKDGSCKIYKN